MTSRALVSALLIAGMIASGHASAQGPSVALPPIRQLGPIIRVSGEALDYISAIRVLSDGRVLANDTWSNRVVLFDSSLARFTTIDALPSYLPPFPVTDMLDASPDSLIPAGPLRAAGHIV